MSLAVTSNDKINRLYDYWSALRAGDRLPCLEDFDPLRVPDLLPNIWLLGWQEENGDFVCRIAGEAVLLAHKRPMHHRSLSQIYGSSHGTALRERYRRVCSEPCAYHVVGLIYTKIDRFGLGERLILPLLDRDGRTPLILGCSLYFPATDSRDLPDGPSGGTHYIRTFLGLDGQVLSRERVNADPVPNCPADV